MDKKYKNVHHFMGHDDLEASFYWYWRFWVNKENVYKFVDQILNNRDLGKVAYYSVPSGHMKDISKINYDKDIYNRDTFHISFVWEWKWEQYKYRFGLPYNELFDKKNWKLFESKKQTDFTVIEWNPDIDVYLNQIKMLIKYCKPIVWWIFRDRKFRWKNS